jgi:phenylpropionate dioxygenase-like ring-hydroxylating dioxygenase large terminal subunit
MRYFQQPGRVMSIEPTWYYDDLVFHKEITDIWGKRVFVGTVADFPELNSYKTIQLGIEPITIRKTPQGIRAFSNVCLHRNALIDPAGSGKKEFRCPYHAWTYDSDGILQKAPKVDIACLSRSALRTWRINVEGGLVFLGSSDLDTTKVLPALQRMGNEYSAPFYKSHIDHNCNWKLLVENVLEGYHVSSAHPKTFVPTGITTNAKRDWSFDDYVSWGTHFANNNPRLASIIKGTRFQYGHVYVFPNVVVANSNDHIGYIGRLIPVGPTQTRLEFSLFEQPLSLKQPEGIRQMLRDTAIDFTNSTLLEDKALVESCQVGLRSSDAGYQLQDKPELEARVINFQSVYNGYMTHD